MKGMASLTSLAPGVWYLPGAVNSFVVAGSGQTALLIDTGLDDGHARKLLRALEEAGLTPGGILNTHSHADHHGGNRLILEPFSRTRGLCAAAGRRRDHPSDSGAAVAVWSAPAARTADQIPARPPSPARLAPEPGLCRIGGADVELIEVAGHASLMYAVRVGEVLYAADALFGEDALNKRPLTFCADSGLQKDSAEELAGLEGVPHGAARSRRPDFGPGRAGIGRPRRLRTHHTGGAAGRAGGRGQH